MVLFRKELFKCLRETLVEYRLKWRVGCAALNLPHAIRVALMARGNFGAVPRRRTPDPLHSTCKGAFEIYFEEIFSRKIV